MAGIVVSLSLLLLLLGTAVGVAAASGPRRPSWSCARDVFALVVNGWWREEGAARRLRSRGASFSFPMPFQYRLYGEEVEKEGEAAFETAVVVLQQMSRRCPLGSGSGSGRWGCRSAVVAMVVLVLANPEFTTARRFRNARAAAAEEEEDDAVLLPIMDVSVYV